MQCEIGKFDRDENVEFAKGHLERTLEVFVKITRGGATVVMSVSDADIHELSDVDSDDVLDIESIENLTDPINLDTSPWSKTRASGSASTAGTSNGEDLETVTETKAMDIEVSTTAPS